MIDALISLLFYITISIITSCILNKEYKQYKKNNKKNKISLSSSFFIAILYSLYNMLVTNMNSSTCDDRKNYVYDFYYGRESSPGLDFMMSIVKRYSNNIRILYYLTTFIVVFLLFIAYNNIDQAKPLAIIFVLCTQYIFLSFTGLKQIYAVSLILLILSFLNRYSYINIIRISICLIVAIAFHPTALIFVPIYILVKLKKTKTNIFLFFLGLLIIAIELIPVLKIISKVCSPIIPSVSFKINEYILSGNMMIGEESFIGIILKGVPFYLLTIWGIINRKIYKKKINNYDTYLLLTAMLGYIYVISIYNGWIYRLAYYLFLPVGIYISEILDIEKNRFNRIVLVIIGYGINIVITMRFLILVHVKMGGF